MNFLKTGDRAKKYLRKHCTTGALITVTDQKGRRKLCVWESEIISSVIVVTNDD